MEILLRPVRDSDSQALINLIGSCYGEYEGCILDLDEEPWLKAPASYYKENGGTFWVIEMDGKVCASAAIKLHGPGVAEPKTVYVAKHARRRGLASFLMRLIESYAKLNGINQWSCWSDTRFTDAHRLYEHRLGYIKTGETRELNDLSNSVEFEFTKVL